MAPGDNVAQGDSVTPGRSDNRGGSGDRGGSVPGLFDRLLDDAAVFPPGNAPLRGAVADHLSIRRRPRGRFVGCFVLPARRWDELVAVLATAPEPFEPLDVILVAGDGRGALADVLDDALAEQRIRLRGVEVASADLLVADRSAGQPPDGAATAVEVPLDGDPGPQIARLAAAGHRAKLRTGGLTAAAFPGEASLARGIVACVAADVPVKLTAGLHSAVRHRDPSTGFEHHGFLNVLLAADQARSGAVPGEVERVLAERDGARVAQAVHALQPNAAARIRRTVVSVGTCSIAEPLGDLVALGLLGRDDVA